MLKILICEESLILIAKELLSEYQVNIAYCEQDILELSFENEYNLYIVNYYFYSVMLDLENFNKNSKIIFVDEYYDILRLKQSFKIGDDYITKPLILEELQIRVNYYYQQLYSANKTIISYKKFFFHKNTKQLFLNKVNKYN